MRRGRGGADRGAVRVLARGGAGVSAGADGAAAGGGAGLHRGGVRGGRGAGGVPARGRGAVGGLVRAVQKLPAVRGAAPRGRRAERAVPRAVPRHAVGA